MDTQLLIRWLSSLKENPTSVFAKTLSWTKVGKLLISSDGHFTQNPNANITFFTISYSYRSFFLHFKIISISTSSGDWQAKTNVQKSPTN